MVSIVFGFQIRWGKTVVENVENTLGDPIEPLEKSVEASHTAYTFKHLSNNTYYSFVVIAGNAAGEGIKHINPQRQRTDAGRLNGHFFSLSCFILLSFSTLLLYLVLELISK